MIIIAHKGIGPHMHCWSPLPFINIEEGVSTFIYYHHCTLIFVLVFLEEATRVHKEIIGEL
jgi:hypothetical protein